MTLRREAVHNWPAFREDRSIPAGLGVVSVEVRRHPDEPIASAASAGANFLQDALEQFPEASLTKFWLLALGQPTFQSNRVAAYKARRDKLWLLLEKSGVQLPSGNRVETEIDPSDKPPFFGGSIDFSVAELPRALEVTRRTAALCVGTTSREEDFDWAGFIPRLEALEQEPLELLRAGLRLAEGGTFIARSFGRFDDAIAGAEIFAGSELLNPLEAVGERLVNWLPHE